MLRYQAFRGVLGWTSINLIAKKGYIMADIENSLQGSIGMPARALQISIPHEALGAITDSIERVDGKKELGSREFFSTCAPVPLPR